MEPTNKKYPIKYILLIIFAILTVFAVYYFSTNSGNEDEPMSYEEIIHLAENHQLDNVAGTNQHLSFIKGDYDYWTGQQLPKKEMKIQFDARKRILDAANEQKRKIESQEDLAHEVGVLIISDIAKKYKLDSPKGYNPHLVLDQGDFSYWKNKNLSLEEIEQRFKIMNELLQGAEKDKILIQTKSELGYLVEKKLKTEG